MKTILEVKSECLQGCAQAFASNLQRTATSAITAAEIAFSVRRDQLFYANAIFKATNKGHIQFSDFVDKEAPEGVHEEVERQMEAFTELSVQEKNRLKILFGINYVEAMIASHPGMRDSMDALFSSIILGAWTAFETLCGDLWAAGVDYGESEIMGRLLISNQWEKPDDSIKAQNVPQMESNPKTHPGSFFREVGKVSFQKVHLVKRYYGLAFGEAAEKLFDQISNGDIWLLSSFRNVIAHASGKADRQFIARMDRFPEFKHIKIGDALLLDGALVKRLRNSAAELGAALLHHVDAMIPS